MGKRSFAARLQQLFSAHDMTLGAPWKRILEFAIPMLIGNLAQQLYNTADSIIVGRYVGDNALAAVGSASPILNLLLALFLQKHRQLWHQCSSCSARPPPSSTGARII